MVLVSTIFKALWKIVGLALVGAENLAYCGFRASGVRRGECGGVRKRDDTYSCVEKAFILHTNCFAEHFVFE